MKTRRYYSAESARGTSSSMGFSNDTIVRVFESKKSRDQYVKDADNISVIAIKRNEVTTHAANWSSTDNCLIEPRPFSGQFWGIVSNPYDDYADDPAGQIGTIEVCNDDLYEAIVDRFYH